MIMEINIMKLLYDIPMQLLELSQAFYDFLFEPITVIGITFSGWQLLGGGFLTVILVAVILKYIVPLL